MLARSTEQGTMVSLGSPRLLRDRHDLPLTWIKIMIGKAEPKQFNRGHVDFEVLPTSSTVSLCFTVRVDLKFPLNRNRADVYAHVVVVREHAWRTLCSVCATGARVAQSVPSNLSFLRCSAAPSRWLFQVVVSVYWYGLV